MNTERSRPASENLLFIGYYFPPVRTPVSFRLFHLFQEARKHFAKVWVLTTRNRNLFQQDDSLKVDHEAISELPTLDLRRLSLTRRRNGSPNISSETKKRKSYRLFSRLMDSFPFNLFLADGSILYILSGYREGKKLVKENKITHLFSSFRPFADHVIAWLLKRRYPHLVWICDFQDLPVDPALKNVIFPRFQHSIIRKMLLRADVVCTVSRGLAEFLKRYTEPVIVLYNLYVPASAAPFQKKFPRFTISYTGTLYGGRRDPSPLLSAVSQLIRNKKIPAEDLSLIYAGPEKVLWDQLVANHDLSVISESFDPLSRNEALNIQQRSHLNLLLTWSSEQVQGVLSGKLFEYLAADTPVIALVSGHRDPELEEILDKYRAGSIFYAHLPETVERLSGYLFAQYQSWLSSGQDLPSRQSKPRSSPPLTWEGQWKLLEKTLGKAQSDDQHP